MIDIHALARELGRATHSLIALDPRHDPFHLQDRRQTAARWFAEHYRRLEISWGAHPRRCHYRFISAAEPIALPDGTDYQNTQEHWRVLVSALRDAVYLGLIDPDAVGDKRNAPPRLFLRERQAAEFVLSGQDCSPASLTMPATPSLYLVRPSVPQPYHLELWVEKSTIDDILEPLARRYQLNLLSGAGELSLTQCRDLVKRAAASQRPVRILYLSDFDPGGASMPVAAARKIEFLVAQRAELGLTPLDIQLRPIILTADQVKEYDLPHVPLKPTETRGRGQFDEGGVELDALVAIREGELERIVTHEIRRYYDPSLAAQVHEVAEPLGAEVTDANDQVTAEFSEPIADLQAQWDTIEEQLEAWREAAESTWSAITDRLVKLAPDIDDVTWYTPPPADEDPDPLFSSCRNYVEQINRYKVHQNKPLDAPARVPSEAARLKRNAARVQARAATRAQS